VKIKIETKQIMNLLNQAFSHICNVRSTSDSPILTHSLIFLLNLKYWTEIGRPNVGQWVTACTKLSRRNKPIFPNPHNKQLIQFTK
jgi:hypothetical protein